MKKTMTIVLLLIISLSGYAQPSLTNQEVKEKLKKLHPLVGKWKGSGFVILPNGQKEEFTQSEDVKFLLDSTMIFIEGKGHSSKVPDHVVHHAIGLFYWNMKEQRYSFDGHMVQGQHTMAKAEFNDQGDFVWSFETSNGDTIKYVITFDDSRWTEDGFFVRKGTTQEYPFFHMELEKDQS